MGVWVDEPEYHQSLKKKLKESLGFKNHHKQIRVQLWFLYLNRIYHEKDVEGKNEREKMKEIQTHP